MLEPAVRDTEVAFLGVDVFGKVLAVAQYLENGVLLRDIVVISASEMICCFLLARVWIATLLCSV
jgi:hypothetical protein